MIKKRVARALTIFDYDDLLFLKKLKEVSEGKQKNKVDFMGLHFDYLKKQLNMSYNACLTHERRLLSYGFISSFESGDKKWVERFEGKKIKFIFITPAGRRFLDYIFSFDYIKEKFRELFK